MPPSGGVTVTDRLGASRPMVTVSAPVAVGAPGVLAVTPPGGGKVTVPGLVTGPASGSADTTIWYCPPAFPAVNVPWSPRLTCSFGAQAWTGSEPGPVPAAGWCAGCAGG